jgi:monothiol glutaredoxin
MPELDPQIRAQLTAMVQAAPIVLFMKGTRLAPSCGFSAKTVDVLDDILEDYVTIDVLADPIIRENIKLFADWPTIPQLFVHGEFVGGAEIIAEMVASGELQQKVGALSGPKLEPKLTITDRARAAFAGTIPEGTDVLHMRVDTHFDVELFVDVIEPDEIAVQSNGITLYLDKRSARRADGGTIDFVDEHGVAGFKIELPKAPPKVRQISPAELAGLRASNTPHVLIDVRTPHEREIAVIEGARMLDETFHAELLKLPKDTKLVFQCHHGTRSQAAAEHFLLSGFSDVNNLRGGIDAWSMDIDPDVTRY